MTRLLIFAILFFLGYTLFSALARFFAGGKTVPKEKTPGGEDMVRDPQCGTYLPRGDALEKTVKGERHYFCSVECRDGFSKKK